MVRVLINTGYMVEKIGSYSWCSFFADWAVHAFAVNMSGESVLLPIYDSVTSAVRKTTQEVGQQAAELIESGGVFFGSDVDPFHASYPDVMEFTSEVFSACQGLGVPAIFLTRHFSWAAEYPGYAMMLGIRPNLAAFGACFGGVDSPTDSPASERIEALRTLHSAGFKTWAVILVTDFADALSLAKELASCVDVLYFDCHEALASELSEKDARLLEFVKSFSAECDERSVPWFFLSNAEPLLPDYAEHFAGASRFRFFDVSECVPAAAVDSVAAADAAFKDAVAAVAESAQRGAAE